MNVSLKDLDKLKLRLINVIKSRIEKKFVIY